MKNKILLLNILALAFCFTGNAQSNIENVLAEIRINNKTILANIQLSEARKLQFKTGLTPVNPTVEYDFLTGKPASAGKQHDLTITQQFDFPTSYVKKSQLAKTQSSQVESILTASRQNVLLEAKKYCIQLVFRNKLSVQLAQQKQNLEKLLVVFQTRLDKGEGDILDLNKAKLQLIQINKQVQQNISDISQFNQKLTALNGGKSIAFTDTTYESIRIIPAFEQLETEYENADPLRKILEQGKLIAQKQVELSKSLWLPKMELGYHYQGILGQTYNGIHTGISIPLWENKNTVKQKRAEFMYSDLQLEEHRNEHYYHIKNLYEKYINLEITIKGYQNIFATLNHAVLLDKAYTLGEITTIQYFMEMNYYTEALTNYLQTEKDFFETIAELYKFQL